MVRHEEAGTVTTDRPATGPSVARSVRALFVASVLALAALCASGCEDETCVAPTTSGDRVRCSADVPCCEGYTCTGGVCTGCPSADRPCVEGPGLDPDSGL
jgi:hypothetical protein